MSEFRASAPDEGRSAGTGSASERPSAAGSSVPEDSVDEQTASTPPGSGPPDHPVEGRSARAKEPEQTLLEQMGGVSGLAYSAVPIIVFVVVNSLTSMVPAIWTAIGVSVVIAVARVVRKEPLQPAISGVIGVAACSFIAYKTGDAKGFFLLGIWTSLVYGTVFLISVLVRWPLIGVAWSALNGLGFSWRHYRRAMTAYDLATLSWIVVFGAKFIVQHWLYAADETGWLAFARIAMGYPLTGLALIVTVWAIRRVARVEEAAENGTDSAAREDAATVRSHPSTR